MAPPDLGHVLDAGALSRLPDSRATDFVECLAARLGISPANILAANGSTELIHLIALTYFGRGDSVLVLEPTFGEYAVACRISGAEVIPQWAKEDSYYAHRIDETADLVRKTRPKGVFICNPNNPTGHYFSRREIEAVLDASPDCLLVMDEAYAGFVADRWSSLDLVRRENLVVTRSMTKDYALGGLRLGYAVAHTQIIETLLRVMQPWNVNAVAQRAGVAVLSDTSDALERSRRQIREAKQYLVRELTRLGFMIVPSETHYFLVKVKSPKDFRAALLNEGLLVRDCTSFGLPEYVRIAARTMPECERLVGAIERITRGR
jgi:histidinol-phosphate aminotransferase